MRFELQIEMDNAAFNDAWQNELARILTAIAEKLHGYGAGRPIVGAPGAPWLPVPVRDINGNRVGRYRFK